VCSFNSSGVRTFNATAVSPRPLVLSGRAVGSSLTVRFFN
jgi:hypothetical protein